MTKKSIDKWQYGDFQRLTGLAQQIVKVLILNHDIELNYIIEPTCGKGAFVLASYEGFENSNILGFEINNEYVSQTHSSLRYISASDRVAVKEADFFDTDCKEILSGLHGYILIIGNPPWVTSSELSLLNSKNLPEKSNFQNRKGIEAIYRKVVLITQKTVGEDTSQTKELAPNTWNYLLEHREFLDRGSSIYKNKPDFSVFGIGPYTFKEWKIAISGFYKRLKFNLVDPLDGKTVAFDDTVNFLSFDNEKEAKFIYRLINLCSCSRIFGINDILG